MQFFWNTLYTVTHVLIVIVNYALQPPDSSFCPTIIDVRSIKLEPVGDHIIPLSTVASSQPDVSNCNIKSECDEVEKPTVTDLQCNDVPSCPSNASSCVPSDCSSSSVGCTLVSLRPLTSFAGSAPPEVSSTAAADKHIGHSISSLATVKLESSPPEYSRFSTIEDSVHLPNCRQPSSKNSNDSSGVRSTQFASSEITARCRVTKTEVVRRCGFDKSSKTVANSSDTVSARDRTLTSRTNDANSRKCNHSVAGNVDGLVRSLSAGRHKSDADSCHRAVTSQTGKVCKLPSTTPNMESRKRKCPTTTKTGIYVYSC